MVDIIHLYYPSEILNQFIIIHKMKRTLFIYRITILVGSLRKNVIFVDVQCVLLELKF